MKTIKNKMVWPGTPGHTPTGVSMTVQGDTLTMRDILIRFSNGILTPSGNAMYGDVEDDEHESADYFQVTNADLVDKQQMLEDRIAFIEVIKQKKEELKKKKTDEAKTATEAT